jgi:hypothetical protein
MNIFLVISDLVIS